MRAASLLLIGLFVMLGAALAGTTTKPLILACRYDEIVGRVEATQPTGQGVHILKVLPGAFYDWDVPSGSGWGRNLCLDTDSKCASSGTEISVVDHASDRWISSMRIYRTTGQFYGLGQPRHPDGSPYEELFIRQNGSCEPATDPALAKPKF